jgi:hypothetical protein
MEAGDLWLTPVILAIWEAERERGWQFKVCLGKKFTRSHLNK